MIGKQRDVLCNVVGGVIRWSFLAVTLAKPTQFLLTNNRPLTTKASYYKGGMKMLMVITLYKLRHCSAESHVF